MTSEPIVKFRAWNGVKMFQPESSDKEDFHVLPDGTIVETHEHGYERHELTSARGPEWKLVLDTGAKDEDGTAVFFWDILILPVKNLRYLVVWDDKKCGYALSLAGTDKLLSMEAAANMHVIGNNYEHPHLLEPQADGAVDEVLPEPDAKTHFEILTSNMPCFDNTLTHWWSGELWVAGQRILGLHSLVYMRADNDLYFKGHILFLGITNGVLESAANSLGLKSYKDLDFDIVYLSQWAKNSNIRCMELSGCRFAGDFSRWGAGTWRADITFVHRVDLGKGKE